MAISLRLYGAYLPDIRFDGSTAGSPSATMTLLPLANSGSGYNRSFVEGGSNSRTITRTAVLPVEAYTGQIYTRVRGRQLAMKVESTEKVLHGSLVARIDMRPDGRR